jgi:hypothetical protein
MLKNGLNSIWANESFIIGMCSKFTFNEFYNLHYLFPLVCITLLGHGTLHRQNLADIELVWSKKTRRSLKKLDTTVLPK